MKLKQILNERAYRKKVLRNGKLVWKWKTDRYGYKIIDGKEVKMSASELRARKKGAKKGARKRKATKSSFLRKLKKSMKMRKMYHL